MTATPRGGHAGRYAVPPNRPRTRPADRKVRLDLHPSAVMVGALLPGNEAPREVPMKRWGLRLRGSHVIAVYLFYKSGEPLVALASSRNLPIEAEQLEALLSVVGNFVETSVPGSKGYAATTMRYENLGIVAVRGEFVIGAAVYDGPEYDPLKDELLRSLRAIEERHWQNLRTWEAATKVAEPAADELSKFLSHAVRTDGPSLRKTPPRKADPPESP